MELDTKQRVLLAMYLEYQKDLPEMDKNLNTETLGLTKDVFYVALDKLVNEELINGIRLKWCAGSRFPQLVIFDNPRLTRVGIDYVENKLQIDKSLDGKNKVRKVSEKAGAWGLDQIKDIAAKVLAEIASKAAGL